MLDFNPNCITYAQMSLIFNSRIYYRRLTTWTRAYLSSRYFGVGTSEALFERLYRETIDIGDMLHLVFGRRYSEEYSQLLSQYAIISHQLIDAQIAGDIQAVNESVKRLYQNVADRSVFLESINPYWSAPDYRNLFNSYIEYTLETANAMVSGDFTRNMELYDLLNELTNRMGDTFAEGVFDYITSGGLTEGTNANPSLNSTPCLTREQIEDIYILMTFWFELIIWIRNYMVRVYTGTGDAEEALNRLLQVPVTYVTTLSRYFPDFDTDAYLDLFYTYIYLIRDFVNAMIENNVDELNMATVALYQNADDRADFLSSVSPLWSRDELRDILYTNLRSTIEESSSFLAQDYEMNIDIFTRLLDQAENTGTLLANGFFQHMAENQPRR